MKIVTSFKRLPVGAKFMARAGQFRKTSARTAVALTPEGRGRTHERIPFSRSASVQQLAA